MYNMIMNKRPDVSLRNRLNNPLRNPIALEKMRKSLTGKKQSPETKLKRSIKLKQYYKDNPKAVEKLQNDVEEKYRSKIRGRAWRMVRLVALDRDEHTCQNCGERNRRLVVHHIDWRGKRRGIPSSQWNNNLENLLTLCDRCHNGIHRHKSSDYQDRYKKKVAP